MSDTAVRFEVHLSCCGMAEPRTPDFDTWDEAHAYRVDWVNSGVADTALDGPGHVRSGIVKEISRV